MRVDEMSTYLGSLEVTSIEDKQENLLRWFGHMQRRPKKYRLGMMGLERWNFELRLRKMTWLNWKINECKIKDSCSVSPKLGIKDWWWWWLWSHDKFSGNIFPSCLRSFKEKLVGDVCYLASQDVCSLRCSTWKQGHSSELMYAATLPLYSKICYWWFRIL